MSKLIAVVILIIAGNMLVIYLLQQQPNNGKCTEQRLVPRFIGRLIMQVPICAKWEEGK